MIKLSFHSSAGTDFIPNNLHGQVSHWGSTMVATFGYQERKLKTSAVRKMSYLKFCSSVSSQMKYWLIQNQSDDFWMRSLGSKVFAKSEKVRVEGIILEFFLLVAGGSNYNQQVLEWSSAFGINASTLLQVIFQVPKLLGRTSVSLFQPLAQIYPQQNMGD